MDNEEKYKMALETIQEILNSGSDSIKMSRLKLRLQSVFPELAESEDERIRKAIHIYLDWLDGRKDCAPKGEYSIKDMIAWLEKQWSESNDVVKCLINGMKFYYEDNPEATWGTEKFSMKVKDILSWLEKQKSVEEIVERYKNSWYNEGKIQGQIEGLSDDEKYQQGWHDALEKQSVQKSFDYENATIQQTDFVPKFAMEAIKEEKVDNANKVEPKDYSSIDPHYFKPIDKVEPKFHEGDWITFYGGELFKILKIEAELNGILDYLLLDQNGYDYYYNKKYVDENARLWTIEDAKDGDVLAVEDKVFIYNGKLDLRGRVCAYCGIYKTYDGLRFTECGIGNYFTYEEPHPATKEQRDLLFSKMKEAGWEFDFDKKKLKKISQRMISAEVKEAMYNKPSWSEEDERICCAIVNGIAIDKTMCKYEISRGICDEQINWLKSLKDRHTWKPSDEQMNLLEELTEDNNQRCFYTILKSLYQDLKKLKV